MNDPSVDAWLKAEDVRDPSYSDECLIDVNDVLRKVSRRSVDEENSSLFLSSLLLHPDSPKVSMAIYTHPLPRNRDRNEQSQTKK